MKSIAAKIAAIIIVGFAAEILIIGSLSGVYLARRIINDINNHEAARQAIMQTAVTKAGKLIDNPVKMEKIMNEYSIQKGVGFVIKDFDGNTIFSTSSGLNKAKTIQEQDFIRVKGKPAYILYGYFPAKLKGLIKSVQGAGNSRGFFICMIMLLTLVLSLIVYEVVTRPLKKLRKAINSLSYGNTVVKIPYHGNDELGLLCRNFEEMGIRLKKSEQSQTELIQAISHDLKTPLTSIIGYVKRLADGKVADGEKTQEYYNIIYRKSMELQSLLNDLEDYNYISSGVKYDMQPVDCNDFFNDMCEEFKHEVEHKGGQFHYANCLEGKYKMKVDVLKIKRVITNIIGNSLKYSGDNAIITVRISRKDMDVICELSDNGPGVGDEHLSKIFDKFYRVENSRSREKGGTGLGLSICRGIIESHGGRIFAANKPEGGLCIYFTIPLITGDKNAR